MSDEHVPTAEADSAIELGALQIMLPPGIQFGEFKACVVYNKELRLTQMILEDTSIIWCAWRGTAHMGHAVDLGYNLEGKLVGIQIWDDMRTRPA